MLDETVVVVLREGVGFKDERPQEARVRQHGHGPHRWQVIPPILQHLLPRPLFSPFFNVLRFAMMVIFKLDLRSRFEASEGVKEAREEVQRHLNPDPFGKKDEQRRGKESWKNVVQFFHYSEVLVPG